MRSLVEDKKKYIGSLLFMAILIGTTFYFLFKGHTLASLIDVLKQADLLFVLLGLAIMMLFECCEAFNIYQLTRSLGIRPRFGRCMLYAFAGFYFSAITPSSSGGQPAQVYFMKKDGIEISHSSLSLMIMLVMFQLVSLLYGIFMFLLRFDFISMHLTGITALLIYGVSVNIAMILAIGGMIFSANLIRRIVMWCVHLLEKIRLVKNKQKVEKMLDDLIAEYQRGAEHIRQHPVILIRVLATSVIQVTALYSIPYIVYHAFHLHGHSLLDFLAMQAILTIAVSSLPLPGAVGASENSFLKLFAVFFGQQLLFPSMLLSRGISFYSYLIVSGIVAMIAYIRLGKQPTDRLKNASDPLK